MPGGLKADMMGSTGQVKRPMSPLLVIRLFSFWQMQLVAAVVILLLPLASYLAAVRRRGRRQSRFVPPAEKVGE